MRFAAVFGCISVLFVIGCAPSVAVNHDYDTQADFARLKTFRWLRQPATARAGVRTALEHDGLLDAGVKRVVTAQLEAKGYRQQEGSSDFVVACHAGAEDRIDVTDWGYGYGPYRRRIGGGFSVTRYKEGTLVLDIVDTMSMQLIWRGSARGTLDPRATSAEREQRLEDAVARMLARFPPQAAK